MIEEEIADLLATHATPGALMDDGVFGAVNHRTGFYDTLYGMADAQIDVHDTWLCDDGSQGGLLWQWHGTNNAGNPFQLAGISLITHDEDGLIAYELVTYPYPDAYVRETFMGRGNEGFPWSPNSGSMSPILEYVGYPSGRAEGRIWRLCSWLAPMANTTHS